MKRIIAILLALSLLLLSACAGGEVTVDTDGLLAAMTAPDLYEDTLYELDAEQIAILYELPAGTEAHVFASSGGTAEETALFISRDAADAALVEETVRERITDREEVYRSYAPKESGKLSRAVLLTRGVYTVLCVSADDVAARKAIESFIK